ncbi:poliovirus receptor isoform X2 [Nycticebus coucang]|uniref:poliovirus receptor isoform X2 n=1 Tax=Nycticebus coucang TaxID=9470 RepID=UPI00234C5F29|nr:poliovirus receptor isoform X2 [Nycticebus coucang]
MLRPRPRERTPASEEEPRPLSRDPGAQRRLGMAGLVLSGWLLLVLSLVWLFCIPPAVGTGTVRVLASTQVRGLLGNSVTLPCHLQPLEPGVQVTQVTWMRQELAGQPSSLAVFHPARGPWYSDPGRLEFVAKSTDLLNASLVVSQLRVEDEANYTCQFATFPQGSSSNSTWLRVLVQPQNTAEPQMEPPSLFTSEPVPVARCMSTGGRPAAQITWSSHLNGTVNNSQVVGPLPGTFTVISFLTVVPSSQVDGKNITCRVDHESFKEPQLLPVNLTVFYPPEVSISGYDGKWYLNQREANLTCNVRSNPEPTSYNWSTPVRLSQVPCDHLCGCGNPGVPGHTGGRDLFQALQIHLLEAWQPLG